MVTNPAIPSRFEDFLREDFKRYHQTQMPQNVLGGSGLAALATGAMVGRETRAKSGGVIEDFTYYGVPEEVTEKYAYDKAAQYFSRSGFNVESVDGPITSLGMTKDGKMHYVTMTLASYPFKQLFVTIKQISF